MSKKVKNFHDKGGCRVVRIKDTGAKANEVLEDLTVQLANSQIKGVITAVVAPNGAVRTRIFGEVNRDTLALTGAYLTKWAVED
jgi:hypothetical protein